MNRKIVTKNTQGEELYPKTIAEQVVTNSTGVAKTQEELNKEVDDKLNTALNSTISSKVKPNGVDVKLHIGDIYTVASIPTYDESKQTPSGLLDEYLYTDITEMRDESIPDLQSRVTRNESAIDALQSRSDVVDVVGTIEELNDYDVSTITLNDVIKVLKDSTKDNAETYYRLTALLPKTWTFIGSLAETYTKTEADETFVKTARLAKTTGISESVPMTQKAVTDEIKVRDNEYNLSSGRYGGQKHTLQEAVTLISLTLTDTELQNTGLRIVFVDKDTDEVMTYIYKGKRATQSEFSDVSKWEKLVSVVQTTGQSDKDVMSQKAVTDAVAPIADKKYNKDTKDGMGRVNLPKKDTLSQADFNGSDGQPLANTIFVIQYDFTLNGIITFGENCILLFDGGRFTGGKLKSNKTKVISVSDNVIFDNVEPIATDVSCRFIGHISDKNVVGSEDNNVMQMLALFDCARLYNEHSLNYKIIKSYGSTSLIGYNTNINILSKKGGYCGFEFFGDEIGYVDINGINIIDGTPRGVYSEDSRHSMFALQKLERFRLWGCNISTRGSGIVCWGTPNFADKINHIDLEFTKINADMFCIEDGAKNNKFENSELSIFDDPFYGGDIISNVGNIYAENTVIGGSIEAKGFDRKITYQFEKCELSPYFGVSTHYGDIVGIADVNLLVNNCTYQRLKDLPSYVSKMSYGAVYKGISNVDIRNSNILRIAREKYLSFFRFDYCKKVTIEKCKFDTLLQTENIQILFRIDNGNDYFHLANNTIYCRVSDFLRNWVRTDYNNIDVTYASNVYKQDNTLYMYRRDSSGQFVRDDSILYDILYKKIA